ncbi:MAG TPA: hypothetical protein ENN09_00635 [Planctomycetes bacterium]|nr:hypothetical protein [Planctomycetota bacterium]
MMGRRITVWLLTVLMFMRVAAAENYAKENAEHGLQELIRSVQMAGTRMQADTLKRIAPDGGKDAVAALAQMLRSSKSDSEICGAVEALAAYGELANHAASDMLRIYVEPGRSNYVKRTIAWSIGELGKSAFDVARPVYTLAQQENNDELRMALYTAYGRLTGNPGSVSVRLIERATRPGSEGIAALRGIGNLGTGAVLQGMEVLSRKVVSKMGYDRRFNEMAARAFALGGPQSAQRAAGLLRQVYQDPSFETKARIWAAAGLIEAGAAGDAEPKFLAAAFKSQSYDEAETAADAIDLLIKVKRHEVVEEHLVAALREMPAASNIRWGIGLMLLRRMGPAKSAEPLFQTAAGERNWETRYIGTCALKELASKK